VSWYHTAFGERYLELYAHRDAAEAARALDTLFGKAFPAGKQVLDLACGSGRYLRELRRRGARVVGLDLSWTLLEEARRQAAAAWLVRADMRRIPLRTASVDVTLSMFTSFGYFETALEHADLAREIGRVTRGDVVIDVPNPETLRRTLTAESERMVNGRRVRERRWLQSRPLRVCKTIDVVDPERAAPAEHYVEHVLLFSPQEVEAMFAPLGFAVRRILGDYDGAPFDAAESPRSLVHLARGEGRGR
jgi:SAM-dependent methyltransferase